MKGSHRRAAFPGAHHIGTTLATILAHDSNAFTHDVLSGLNISTADADTLPWLPSPRCNHLTTQQCLSSASPVTGYEWASLLQDMMYRLLPPDPKSRSAAELKCLAQPRHARWDCPWECLLATGEQKQPDYWNLLWQMVFMLEAEGCLGCVAADNSHEPLPGDVPYRRSELVCLLALVCQEARRDPANTRIAPTVVMLTNTTARVLQARIELPQCDSPDPPKIHIIQRLNLPLHLIRLTPDGNKEAASEEWLELLSWLSFGSPAQDTYALSAPLQEPKPRLPKASGYRTVPSETFSERAFSGASRSSEEDQQESVATSPLSLSPETSFC